MQRQQDQRRVEQVVAEGQPVPVVHHVWPLDESKRADVHRADPGIDPPPQRRGDVALARPEVEDPESASASA
jgi:hypothetical protein